MLIVMGGLPKAGKTTFVRLLRDRMPDLVVFGPDEMLPKNLESLSEEEQKELRIAAWQKCHERALSFCTKKRNRLQIAVYDTTGSNLSSLEELERMCSIYDHDLLYVFVHDLKERCRQRGVEGSLLDVYFEKLKSVLGHFRPSLTIIKNRGSLSELIGGVDVVEKTCRAKLSSKTPMTSGLP